MLIEVRKTPDQQAQRLTVELALGEEGAVIEYPTNLMFNFLGKYSPSPLFLQFFHPSDTKKLWLPTWEIVHKPPLQQQPPKRPSFGTTPR